jgi:ribulose-phosphate 3-epimerase
MDVHLMVAPVDAHVDAFAKAGADSITVHHEAGPHVHRTLQAIRGAGCRAGLALNPGTGIDPAQNLLDDIDVLCVMTVNPGFGGQRLIPAMLGKVQTLRALIGRRPIRLQVDGGVSLETARHLAQAGADLLVAGSAVFQGGPQAYARNLAALREAAAGAST